MGLIDVFVINWVYTIQKYRLASRLRLYVFQGSVDPVSGWLTPQ